VAVHRGADWVSWRSCSAVPPAPKKSAASFTGLPSTSGSSSTRMDGTTGASVAATAAACLRPGASLSAMTTAAVAPLKCPANSRCHLPAPPALQVAARPACTNRAKGCNALQLLVLTNLLVVPRMSHRKATGAACEGERC
jgi:hypothetical protein